MADDPTTQDPQYAQTLQWARDQLTSLQAQPKIDTTGSPADGTRQSWTSLFGDVLGGGQGPGYQLRGQEADTAGNRALLNFGINMLLASGPQRVKPDVLSAAAQGLQGAQQSLDVDQRRGALAAGAQQEYAQKQQEMQIARIKEAVPLLTLLQQSQSADAARRMAGTTPTAPIAGTNIAAPTTFEGAIAGHEGTGKNPNSSATGVGQFLDSTWQGFTAANPDLFKGMTPEQVAAARNDPAIGAKAINWLAQQNALTLQMAGVQPSGTSLGIAHYLGAKPAAAVMQAPDGAPVKGFVSEAAVKANPELGTMTAGQLRARYANTPNPGFLAPPGGAQPPKPYQVATAGAAVPPPPGGAPAAPPPAATPVGNLGLVQKPDGSVGTPGGGGLGTQPAQPPAPVATPAPTQPTTPPPSPYPDIKAGDGIIRYPGTLAEFRAREYVPPPASEVYSPNLTPEKQQAFAIRQQGLQLKQQQINNLSDPVAVQKGLIEVKAEQAALQADMLTAANDKKEAADKALVEYNKTQDERIQKHYEKVAGDYSSAAQSQLTSAQKLAEVNAQAGATERTAALNPINTEAGAAAHRLDDLQVLKGFSNNLGDPTFLTSQKIGGHSLADIISGAGLGSQALQDKAGQAQAFRAAALSIVRDLRMGGAAAGEPRSNQDLNFITSMVPSEMQSPATRNAIISYIEQVNQRRMEYGAEVGRLVNTPEFSNNVGGAMLAARKAMPDIVQTVPKEIALGGGDIGQQRLDWFRKNVPPGSFYRAPNGRMQVWHGVKGDPDYAE